MKSILLMLESRLNTLRTNRIKRLPRLTDLAGTSHPIRKNSRFEGFSSSGGMLTSQLAITASIGCRLKCFLFARAGQMGELCEFCTSACSVAPRIHPWLHHGTASPWSEVVLDTVSARLGGRILNYQGYGSLRSSLRSHTSWIIKGMVHYDLVGGRSDRRPWLAKMWRSADGRHTFLFLYYE